MQLLGHHPDFSSYPFISNPHAAPGAATHFHPSHSHIPSSLIHHEIFTHCFRSNFHYICSSRRSLSYPCKRWCCLLSVSNVLTAPFTDVLLEQSRQIFSKTQSLRTSSQPMELWYVVSLCDDSILRTASVLFQVDKDTGCWLSWGRSCS